MERPVSVTARNVTLDPRIEQIIHRRAAKLERFHPRLVGCSVVVEGPGRRRRSCGPYKLQIDLRVPGGAPLVINRQQSETLEEAVSGAFAAAERALEDFARQRRGDVKSKAGGAQA